MDSAQAEPQPVDAAASPHDAADSGGCEWVGIDHVQLAIPPGGEDVARAFFVDRLGFSELPKPAVMAARGGAWFEAGAVQIHVGAEAEFVPARKAHPAFVVRGLLQLVSQARLDATYNDEIPDLLRCHVHDPFGNRIELIDAESLAATTTAARERPTSVDDGPQP